MLNMAHNVDELRARVKAAVQELADRGFRSLGVAVSYTGVEEAPRWELQGILSVFDPPRHDTKATIEAAYANGVEVKMVTGDHTAIAVETCRMLGMGTKVRVLRGGAPRGEGWWLVVQLEGAGAAIVLIQAPLCCPCFPCSCYVK